MRAVESDDRVVLSGSQLAKKAADLLYRCGRWHFSTPTALYKRDLPTTFDADLEKHAARLAASFQPSQIYASRVHRDDRICFTIDDRRSDDLDDALSISKTSEGGWQIGVHISAVAAIVPIHSPCDLEARRRSSSIYLPDRTWGMFPDCLANDTLSLVEGEIRPVLSFYINVTSDFSFSFGEIKRETICVAKRLTYESADDRIRTGYGMLADELCDLLMCTDMHRAERQQNGAIDIGLGEMTVAVESDGEVVIEHYDNAEMSRGLVAECMIMANAMAGDWARQHGLPVIYRKQASPNDAVEPLLAESERQHLSVVQSLAIRKHMMPATHSLVAGRHAGLGIDSYVQVTSPIRRYSDLWAHRLIENALASDSETFDAQLVDTINPDGLLYDFDRQIREIRLSSAQERRKWLLQYLDQNRDALYEVEIIDYESRRSLMAEVYLYQTQMRLPLACPQRFDAGTRHLVKISAVDAMANLVRLAYHAPQPQ